MPAATKTVAELAILFGEKYAARIAEIRKCAGCRAVEQHFG